MLSKNQIERFISIQEQVFEGDHPEKFFKELGEDDHLNALPENEDTLKYYKSF